MFAQLLYHPDLSGSTRFFAFLGAGLWKIIPVDRSTLPQGDYRDVGHETRQVFDIDISTVVTEWRAQILEDLGGKRYVAQFPDGVTRPVQYGVGVKVNAVYMSQYQLIPYNCIEDHFWDQMQIPVSAWSINNFNKDAFDRLEFFDYWVRRQLSLSPLVHADETGINIDGKGNWLHNASNGMFSYFYPHAKRWMRWEFLPVMVASFVMITGNHIANMAFCMRCATPTTCENLKEPSNRTNNNGPSG